MTQADPNTRLKDLRAFGIRQTWHQWCHGCGLDPAVFAEPWVTRWRAGLTPAEAHPKFKVGCLLSPKAAEKISTYRAAQQSSAAAEALGDIQA